MARDYPVIWVLGATRSCKTPLTQLGIVPLGYKMLSTADYFRERYGKEDTNSEKFVFDLSNFSAACLSENADCHADHLRKLIQDANQPCVIEGERNPFEFAKLFDPKKDMAIFLHRRNMRVYDTVIERGLADIENNVHWAVSTGITPRAAVCRISFDTAEVKAELFGVNNGPDQEFMRAPVKAKKLADGVTDDRYPWNGLVVGIMRKQITDYLGGDMWPEFAQRPGGAARQPTPAPAPTVSC